MASGGPPGRLRGELTEFVGRRAELALVRQALGTARLVTLIGPGGIGKTRLAIEAASGARRAFGDGAWLAELGGLRDAALLVPEVARSLGLSDRSARRTSTGACACSRPPARRWSATSTTSRSSRWPAWWPSLARCRTGAARSAGPTTGADPKEIR
jgi:MoxR-like ATPase